MNADRPLISRLEAFPQFAGGFVILAGILALSGWIFDVELLKSILPGKIEMNPTTAIAFILAGVSLGLSVKPTADPRARRVAQMCALLIATVGLLRLAGYLFALDVGIDQVLFRDRLAGNRMAPNTAFNFLLIGAALLGLDLDGRRVRYPGQILILAAAFVAWMAVLGYIYSVTFLYGVASYVPMALNTALAFLLLCVGLLCARPNHGLMALLASNTPGGIIARRLIPAFILICAFLGWLRLIGEHAGIFNFATGVAVLVVAMTVVACGLIWWNALSLNRADARRHQAEEASRASEQRLQAILDNTTAVIYVKDTQSRYMLINRQHEKLFHATRNQVVGKSDYDLFPKATADAFRANDLKVLESKTALEFEEIAPQDDGVHTYLSLKFPLFDAAGAPYAVCGISTDITERKRSEAALRAAETKFRTLVEQLPSITYEADFGVTSSWHYVSPQVERLLGFTPQEWLANPELWYQQVHPDDRARAVEAEIHSRATGEPMGCEYRIFARDGRLLWFRDEAVVVRDAEGKPLFLQGIMLDITERKRSERRLGVQYAVARVMAEAATLSEASPRILQAICESVDWEVGVIWTVDRQSRLLRCVDVWHPPGVKLPVFEQKTRESAFAIGVGLPGRVWATAKPAWIEDVVKDANFPRAPFAAQDGLHGAFGFPILLRNEVFGAIEFFSREIRKPDPDLLDMFAAVGSQIGQFIERRRTREALSHERDLLQALMDSIPDMIYFKDKASRFTRINRAQAKLLGLSDPRDALGKTDFDFFNHAPEAFSDEQKIMQSGQPLIGKVEKIRGADGQWRFVSSTKVPLLDKEGRPAGLVGISRDVSELKQAQEQLSSYAEELRQKNEQMEADLDMAREIQQVMLPRQFSSFPRSAAAHEVSLRFFHRYWPVTKLGGDFFDMLPLSQTEAGLFICDVMGHGVRSALVTAMMRTLVEESSPVTTDPGQFLAKINQVLLGILRQAEVPTFASAFYLVADVARGQIRYANAGHPVPFHLRRSAGVVERLALPQGQTGPALGIHESATYATAERSLAVNDLIVLFTDGLFEVEGANKEYFGQERLIEAVRERIDQPPPRLFAELLAESSKFSATGNFTDDVCIVGMEVARIG